LVSVFIHPKRLLLLKIHHFSTGYRIPVIYRTKNLSTPIFLPFTYSITKIRDKAFKTRRRHQAALDGLYQFFEEKGVELDELLLAGQFYTLFDHLPEFFMVHLYRDHEITRPVFAEKAVSIREYLRWAFARYLSHCITDGKKDRIEANFELRLTSFFASYPSFPNFSRKNYKSLSKDEVVHLLEIVHPESEHNPFTIEHRIRNYLMVKLFLNTGIRLGELLLLKTTSLEQNNEEFYLRITSQLDDEDTRSDRPDLKNVQSERIIALTGELFSLIDYYIIHLRRPVKKGQKINLSHGFLFASELGNPLAKSTVSDIFQKINTAIINHGVCKSMRISPHALRHTFADNFLEYLIDVRRLDMGRAKDELRATCGWSANSVMPLHYAGRYISKSANQHNLERIAITHENYRQQSGTKDR
jgi:integrase